LITLSPASIASGNQKLGLKSALLPVEVSDTSQRLQAILAMVRATVPNGEDAVHALIKSQGCRELEITELLLVAAPSHSDDPVMRACHQRASAQDGPFVVYTDSISEA
jgi:hypothetical protein